ncbi:short-chain dehydrogenase [Jannaschia sp. EhC01]|nr:short-chain dehydrogenase [Jannaschia sp. EhC01]
MTSTAKQMRAWRGPALLSFGFRPFFLGAGLWAVLAMLLWVMMLAGEVTLRTAFDPVSWHAHAFLFGYVPAVVAGFLLTAVPNWTGRLPIVGWSLGALFTLWIVGRVAVMFSAVLDPLWVACVDLAMPLVLSAMIGREIVVGKNWRNLIVLAMLVALIIGNAMFHWEAARGDFAAQGYGFRIGLGATLMMVAVIGGRVVPSFTRNWLVKQGAERRPAPPMQRFDKGALLVLLLALILWAAVPFAPLTGAALCVAGVLHVVRLARWAGLATVSEPLVFVLHGSYAFIPLGATALGVELLVPGLSGLGAVQHLWMGGAIGLMTLAVMTRATLGHTGRDLTAGTGTVLIYSGVIGAVVLRVSAGIWPSLAMTLYTGSAVLWVLGFAGFVAIYGPLLLRAKPAKAI